MDGNNFDSSPFLFETTLNLSKLTINEWSQYELKALVLASGGLDSTRFSVCIRVINKWLKIDDQEIKEIDNNFSLSLQTHNTFIVSLLCYESCKSGA